MVTVSVPPAPLAMPPPPKPLLPEKVLLVTISVPPLPLAMPPAASTSPPLPLAMVRFWTVKVMLGFTEKTPTLCPPLIVIRLLPSMVVSALMVLVLVTVIVAAPPQLKVTVPPELSPPGRQAVSADSVQLAPVPVPTTHARARAHTPPAHVPLRHWESAVQLVPALQSFVCPQHECLLLSQTPPVHCDELVQPDPSLQLATQAFAS